MDGNRLPLPPNQEIQPLDRLLGVETGPVNEQRCPGPDTDLGRKRRVEIYLQDADRIGCALLLPWRRFSAIASAYLDAAACPG